MLWAEVLSDLPEKGLWKYIADDHLDNRCWSIVNRITMFVFNIVLNCTYLRLWSIWSYQSSIFCLIYIIVNTASGFLWSSIIRRPVQSRNTEEINYSFDHSGILIKSDAWFPRSGRTPWPSSLFNLYTYHRIKGKPATWKFRLVRMTSYCAMLGLSGWARASFTLSLSTGVRKLSRGHGLPAGGPIRPFNLRNNPQRNNDPREDI